MIGGGSTTWRSPKVFSLQHLIVRGISSVFFEEGLPGIDVRHDGTAL